MRNIVLVICFLICCNSVSSFAQIKKLPSFGKITMEEITQNECPIDTGAQAYYIFDKGDTEFVYLNTTIRTNDVGSSSGFQMEFKRHVRIKILDKAASDVANFEIPLYHRGNDKEKIVSLKGFTYNLVDGKIEKTKLEDNQVITENVDTNIDNVKFAMPEVRAGSIIEVFYSVLSDFYFNLQEWQFQRMFPVLYSEYRVALPQYFYYNTEMLGYLTVKQQKASASRSIDFTVIEKQEGMVGGDSKYTFTEDYLDNITTYYVENVPAFKVEKYLRTPMNYLSKISFELAGTQYPRSVYKNYGSTWEAVSKELIDHEYFGGELNRNGFLKEEVEAIRSKNLSVAEQVSAVFERVKQKMNWNNKSRLYATENIKQAWDKGIGNSADINLTLVAFLRSLDIESYPVVLSTRTNGIIPISHPSRSGFNYVVAMAVVDGKRVLLDATDPFSGLNQLPARCLNGEGRIIDNKISDWVNLCENASSYQMIYGKLTLNGEGEFEGDVEIQEDGYAAWNRRDIYKMHNNDEAFKEAVEKEFNDIVISDFSISGIDSIYNTVKSNYQVSIEDKTDQMGDLMVFNPLLVFSENENPFKLEKREYPVEFPYPSRLRVILSYKVPEGYKVESFPVPQKMVAQDKSFQYIFSASVLGNTIQVVQDFSINKFLFLPADYDSLKNLFAYIVSKQNEKIVLKRVDI